MTHLSSRPTDIDEPTRIELVAPEYGTDISAEMDPRDDSGRIAIKLHSHGLALNDLVDPHQTEGLFDIADGDVRMAGEGWVDGNQLELSLHLDIDSLDAHVDRKPEVGRYLRRRLGRWVAAARRCGPICYYLGHGIRLP